MEENIGTRRKHKDPKAEAEEGYECQKPSGSRSLESEVDASGNQKSEQLRKGHPASACKPVGFKSFAPLSK